MKKPTTTIGLYDEKNEFPLTVPIEKFERVVKAADSAIYSNHILSNKELKWMTNVLIIKENCMNSYTPSSKYVILIINLTERRYII